MTLMPDLYRAYIDPFFAQPTLALFCDVLEPNTGEAYSRDPRGTAKAALAHMEAAGIGDTAFLVQKLNSSFLRTLRSTFR